MRIETSTLIVLAICISVVYSLLVRPILTGEKARFVIFRIIILYTGVLLYAIRVVSRL